MVTLPVFSTPKSEVFTHHRLLSRHSQALQPNLLLSVHVPHCTICLNFQHLCFSDVYNQLRSTRRQRNSPPSKRQLSLHLLPFFFSSLSQFARRVSKLIYASLVDNDNTLARRTRYQKKPPVSCPSYPCFSPIVVDWFYLLYRECFQSLNGI